MYIEGVLLTIAFFVLLYLFVRLLFIMQGTMPPETAYRMAVVIVAFGAATLAVVLALAYQRDLGTVEVTEPAEGETFDFVNPEDLPDIYSGQLVDIDDDDTPDFVLFGAKEQPIVQRATTETESPLWPVIIAVIATAGTIIGAVINMIGKRGSAGKDDDDSESTTPAAP